MAYTCTAESLVGKSTITHGALRPVFLDCSAEPFTRDSRMGSTKARVLSCTQHCDNNIMSNINTNLPFNLLNCIHQTNAIFLTSVITNSSSFLPLQ